MRRLHRHLRSACPPLEMRHQLSPRRHCIAGLVDSRIDVFANVRTHGAVDLRPTLTSTARRRDGQHQLFEPDARSRHE